MAVEVIERTKPVGVITGPKFRDPGTMTKEELTDPDFRHKKIMELFGGDKEGTPAVCSRCHHCRR